MTLLVSFVLAVFAGGAGFVFMKHKQEWTSAVQIRFINKDAKSGYAHDGSLTEDVIKEVLDPGILTNAAAAMDGQTSYTLASKITIDPVIAPLETERKDSAMKNGLEYEYFPEQYKITYLTDEEEDIQKNLSGVITSFLNNFTEKHTGAVEIPANDSRYISLWNEYLINADILAGHVDNMQAFLETQAEKYPGFRSTETGLSYQDLLSGYDLLEKWGTDRIYGEIFRYAAAKNPEGIVSQAELTIQLDASDTRRLDDDMNEAKELLISYSEKQKVYGSSTAQSSSDDDTGSGFTVKESVGTVRGTGDNSIDENHKNILDDLYENDIKDQPAYDTVMRKYISEADRKYMIEETDLYNEYLISLFSKAEPVVEGSDIDTEITGLIQTMTDRANVLYKQAYLTETDHRALITARSVQVLNSPYKEAKFRVGLYTAVLFIGVFIAGFVGLTWLSAIRKNIREDNYLRKQQIKAAGQQESEAGVDVQADKDEGVMKSPET